MHIRIIECVAPHLKFGALTCILMISVLLYCMILERRLKVRCLNIALRENILGMMRNLL